MLRLAITGEREVSLHEVPLPEPRDGEVLLRVEAAAICNEWRGFASGNACDSCGHEAVGTVVGGDGLAAGTRVAAMPLWGCGECERCRSGAYIHCDRAFSEPEAAMAEYLRKPAFLCMPLPDDLSWEEGLLTCCALGPSFGALERLAPAAGETILVTGAGPVGLGAVVNARARGLDVVVAEPQPERAARAAALGARVVERPDVEIAAAVECSGSVAGARLCIDSVRTFGAVAFVGVGPKVELDRWDDLIRRGVTLTSAWHYDLNAFPRVLEVARRPEAASLIAASFPLAEAQAAFEAAAAGAAKVVLHP
ncbi:MAG: zinc-dependent alcohol dehydrogenase [Gaiellaceae bacterium]